MIDANSEPQIFPIVTPVSGDPAQSGQVVNLPVSPQAMPRQLESRGGGRYAVRGAYAEKGWVSLRDLYEAEGNHDGWAKYKRYIEAMAKGTARISFPVTELPKEVQRRRESAGGDDEFGRREDPEFARGKAGKKGA